MSWVPASAVGDAHHPMGPRVLRQRKKKELTPEERLERMKGLSKAFIKENTGWSKVAPVYKENSSSDDDDSSASGEDDNDEDENSNINSKALQNDHDHHNGPTSNTKNLPNAEKPTSSEENPENSEDEEDLDIMAVLRAQTRLMQRERQQEQQEQQQQLSTPPPETTTITITQSASTVQEEQVAEQPSTAATTTATAKAEKAKTRVKKNNIQDPTTMTTTTTTSQTVTDPGKESQLKLLQRLSNMAQTKGREATWKWLQDQIQRGGPGLLVLSQDQSLTKKKNVPNSSNSTSTTNNKLSEQQTTMVLPHPKRHFNTAQQAVQTERQYVQFYRQATHVVPFEYYYYYYNKNSVPSSSSLSDNISITVRRPYGTEARGTWMTLSNMTADHYARRAHISDAAILEVAVLLKCDATRIPLVFVSSSGNIHNNNKVLVRYRTSPGGAMQVKQQQQQQNDTSSLGLFYSYQTKKINDSSHDDGGGGGYQTYDLDDLLQQAIWVREQYCSAVTSTALALRLQAAQLAAEKAAEAAMSEEKDQEQSSGNKETSTTPNTTIAVQTQDVSVDTSDLMPAVEEKTIPTENVVMPPVASSMDRMADDNRDDVDPKIGIKTRSLFMEEEEEDPTEKSSEKKKMPPKSVLDYSLNDVIRCVSNHPQLSRVTRNRNASRVLLALAMFAVLYMFGILHYIGLFKDQRRRELGNNECTL